MRLFDNEHADWDDLTKKVANSANKLLKEVFNKLLAEYPGVHLRDLEYVAVEEWHMLILEYKAKERSILRKKGVRADDDNKPPESNGL